MSFNEETDTYTCANNQKLEFKYTSKQKNRSGYISEKRVYECNNCEGCLFAVKCKNTPHNKKLYVIQKAVTGKYSDRKRNNAQDEQEYSGRRGIRSVKAEHEL